MFFFLVVELQFGELNYTFSENTSVSDAQIEIEIVNYYELVINNDIMVTIVSLDPSTANHSIGMSLHDERYIYYVICAT